MKIVAVSGRVGCGKTTLYSMFQDEGHEFWHTTIAGPLKHEVARTFGVSREWLETNKNIARSLLIAWADFRRYMDPQYWMRQAISNMELVAASKPDTCFYVDDMRYVNEAEQFKALGGTLVRLVCPAQDSIDYMLSKGMTREQAEAAANSEGETTLWKYDELFDIFIAAPRRRPLLYIYEELKSELHTKGII